MAESEQLKKIMRKHGLLSNNVIVLQQQVKADPDNDAVRASLKEAQDILNAIAEPMKKSQAAEDLARKEAEMAADEAINNNPDQKAAIEEKFEQQYGEAEADGEKPDALTEHEKRWAPTIRDGLKPKQKQKQKQKQKPFNPETKFGKGLKATTDVVDKASDKTHFNYKLVASAAAGASAALVSTALVEVTGAGAARFITPVVLGGRQALKETYNNYKEYKQDELNFKANAFLNEDGTKQSKLKFYAKNPLEAGKKALKLGKVASPFVVMAAKSSAMLAAGSVPGGTVALSLGLAGLQAKKAVNADSSKNFGEEFRNNVKLSIVTIGAGSLVGALNGGFDMPSSSNEAHAATHEGSVGETSLAETAVEPPVADLQNPNSAFDEAAQSNAGDNNGDGVSDVVSAEDQVALTSAVEKMSPETQALLSSHNVEFRVSDSDTLMYHHETEVIDGKLCTIVTVGDTLVDDPDALKTNIEELTDKLDPKFAERAAKIDAAADYIDDHYQGPEALKDTVIEAVSEQDSSMLKGVYNAEKLDIVISDDGRASGLVNGTLTINESQIADYAAEHYGGADSSIAREAAIRDFIGDGIRQDPSSVGVTYANDDKWDKLLGIDNSAVGEAPPPVPQSAPDIQSPPPPPVPQAQSDGGAVPPAPPAFSAAEAITVSDFASVYPNAAASNVEAPELLSAQNNPDDRLNIAVMQAQAGARC
ncbi:MAG: hypothetical protein GY804_06025 [Alphaproteobacteria bacterium]|nr:hypothetical protein [Alphaproteobacteria bacterium]